MSLQGLPDFRQPLQGEGFQIFYPYEGVGNPFVTPDGLVVAEGVEGRPEFLLEFVRGQNPDMPPTPYGMLDIRVRPRYPMESALKLLRSFYPDTLLYPIIFSGGFLRLHPGNDSDSVPVDLRVPISLNWNGLTSGRYVIRLSLNSALLLKDALNGEMLVLFASAEMEMAGIAPRLPVRVRFDPSTLLEKINTLANKKRQIAREKIGQFFRQSPTCLPLQVIGEIPDIDEFAETMTDWIRVRFASFIPSPEDDAKPYWLLKSATDVGSGSFEWDLSQPLVTYRPYMLTMHPLESACKLVKENGIEAVTRNTVVPPIPTGVFPISISANLPLHRPGILSIGVTLKAAPHLPFRPQAVIESAEFTSPDDRASLYLRLSPGESLQYTYSTFVVCQDSSGIAELKGPETSHVGDTLYLSPTDFPVTFIPIDATRSLLDLAILEGNCQWKQSGVAAEQQFELDLDQPAIALALPNKAETATIRIKACSRSGTTAVTLGPLPARALELDMHSFREYGPHTVHIECAFSGNTPLLAVDLLPQERPETTDEIGVVALTPAQPKKEWTYFARSPFQAGYRYRRHPRADEAPEVWSEIRSPFENLKITAGGTI